MSTGFSGGFSAEASASASIGGTATASASASASISAGVSLEAGLSLGAGAGAAAADLALLRAFRFRVALTMRTNSPSDGRELCAAGFQECSGLEIETDVQEYLEGGSNDAVVKRIGRAKYPNIVLKRGMLYSKDGQLTRDLWAWIQSIVSGTRPVVRCDGVIDVMSVGDTVVASWGFSRGLPARLRGPELNAKTGEIAIEELHIAHEGLRLL